ncbi:MAG TPA: response regulator [Chthoniobacterales bacterium]|jgi:signal transduction histidine kinase
MLSELIVNARILVIDDELPNVRLLERILRRQDYCHIAMTTDARDAVSMFVDDPPDLVLLDLHMPHQSGYEVMNDLAGLQNPQVPVPIIVLTADATPEARLRALAGGATDFICKPFDNTEVALRIKNALQTRFLQRRLETQNKVLDEQVRERTAALQETLAELRNTQQQVVQQERLRALGMMATGIAHDFNNLLSLIIGSGELLLSQSDRTGRSKIDKYFKTVMSAARDGAKMVNRLTQFQRARSEGEVQQTVCLARLVHQAVDLTRPRWKEQSSANGIDIEIVTELNEEAHVTGDSAEIRELLTNMIFNAVDAMPSGGTITIRISLEGSTVLLAVEDSGTGMSDEVRKRCLEPFFTTKGERGSGLGLAMIYGIVERHGGTLEIESRLGRGTLFQIRLPRTEPSRVIETTLTERIAESLNIMVVDDQPILREILTEQLKNDCHHVVSAADGDEAIQIFHQEPFDIVITDKAMPGMSGEQLATTLKEVRENICVILLTGFAEHGISDSVSPAIDMVLGKPFNLTTLRQAIVKSIASRNEKSRQSTIGATALDPSKPAGVNPPPAGREYHNQFL